MNLCCNINKSAHIFESFFHMTGPESLKNLIPGHSEIPVEHVRQSGLVSTYAPAKGREVSGTAPDHPAVVHEPAQALITFFHSTHLFPANLTVTNGKTNFL